jgi:hypothetical protein
MNIKSFVNAKTLSAVAGAMVARDYLLDRAGLQRRPSTAASVGNTILLLGVGAAVGAGAALLFAPKTGPEIRGDIASKAQQLKGRIMRKNGDSMSIEGSAPAYVPETYTTGIGIKID